MSGEVKGEAPAEAGERERLIELLCQSETFSVNVCGEERWLAGEIVDMITQALRAQPPSREDALRVAVEALEPFARAADGLDGLWSEDDWRWNDSVRSGVTVRDIRRARQALAALQAEQDSKS